MTVASRSSSRVQMMASSSGTGTTDEDDTSQTFSECEFSGGGHNGPISQLPRKKSTDKFSQTALRKKYKKIHKLIQMLQVIVCNEI